MNLSRFALAFLLGLGVLAGNANAQFSKPESLTPPGAQAPGLNLPAGIKLPPGVKLPPGITLPPGVQLIDASQPDDDDIVVIPGPQIGKPEPQQMQVTPQMLEMLYKVVWLKVSKEYQDPYKLRDWAQWETKYKGKLKTEADLDAAIKAMVASLHDRWTVYYSPADIAAQQKAQKDGVVNAGMLLRKHSDNAWHIDGLQFNTPAMLSTLREGDVIKSVNGKLLNEATQPAEVTKLLSGKEGDKLSVVAIYDGSEHAVELTLAKQGPDDIAVGMLPGNIAYIRLPTFVSQETVQNFVKTLGALYAESGGQINGLIFDMRYNGGGLVTMALTVSSMFLENGTVTATTTRTDRSITETHYKVIPMPQYLEARMPKDVGEFQHFLNTVPLVVLTNGSTASASEITTGALKDNGRAFVIGVKTFGKAVGFTDTPLPNGGVIQVTNLTYLTPNGSNIADKGITPDQVVEQPRGQEVLGDKDEQVKAAHEHLLKIAAARAKEMAEAQDLSTKPQEHRQPAAKPAVTIHPLYVLLAGVGTTTSILVLAFVVSRLRSKRRRRS